MSAVPPADSWNRYITAQTACAGSTGFLWTHMLISHHLRSIFAEALNEFKALAQQDRFGTLNTLEAQAASDAVVFK